MTPDEIHQELQLLKYQTQIHGGLHQAQVEHLYVWTQIALPHAAKHSIGWDGENRIFEARGELGKPTFREKFWQFFTQKQPKDLVFRLNNLNQAVKNLLGVDVEVRAVVAGKTVYYNVGQKEQRANPTGN